MLAELYVPAFRTLICVPRNTYLCSTHSLDRVSGVLFLLVYTARRASDKRRIQIIHKPTMRDKSVETLP